MLDPGEMGHPDQRTVVATSKFDAYLDREIDDIVAFMRTLNDGYAPAPARAGR